MILQFLGRLCPVVCTALAILVEAYFYVWQSALAPGSDGTGEHLFAVFCASLFSAPFFWASFTMLPIYLYLVASTQRSIAQLYLCNLVVQMSVNALQKSKETHRFVTALERVSRVTSLVMLLWCILCFCWALVGASFALRSTTIVSSMISWLLTVLVSLSWLGLLFVMRSATWHFDEVKRFAASAWTASKEEWMDIKDLIYSLTAIRPAWMVFEIRVNEAVFNAALSHFMWLLILMTTASVNGWG
jgi:hypothetical protein